MTSMDRPDRPIPGTGTTPTAPPTPAGAPPVASPPPDPTVDLTDGRGGSSTPASVDHGKEAGREVAGHARSEAEEAAGHAAEEAQRVAQTAKSEVRDVVDEARDAVREQADRQAHVAADALGRFRDDLRAMASDEAPRDSTAQYIQRAAGGLDDFVGRLEREGIEGALTSVRSFARRSPGGFLLASAGAGFAIGRIIRNADHPQQVQEQDGGQVSGQQEIDLTGSASRFEERSAIIEGAERTGSFAPSEGGGMRR
ncbi:MAG: hypothetical protein ACLGIC_00895 [Acidimicrobiia bacterium]